MKNYLPLVAIFIFYGLHLVGGSLARADENKLGRALMPQFILNQSGNNAIDGGKHRCHEDVRVISESSSGQRVRTDHFVADIQCQIKCSGSTQTQTKNRQAIFAPGQLGLYAGDGSSQNKIIWRSLGQTLDVWSKNECGTYAKALCSKVEHFAVKKISSGTWSMDGAYDCQRRDIVYSPFDEKKQLNYSASFGGGLVASEDVPGLLGAQSKQHLWTKMIPTTASEDSLKALITPTPASHCQKKAKVFMCFGDCVFEKIEEGESRGPWIETLTTPEYLGESSASVCLDSFAHHFKAGQSAAENDLLCHKLLWEIFYRTNYLGTSCAAFRYNYECPAW